MFRSRKTRSLVAGFLCFFVFNLQTRPADAVVFAAPLVPYIAASFSLHVGVIAGIVLANFTKNGGGQGSYPTMTSHATGNGKMARNTTVTWVDLTGPTGEVSLKSKNVSIRMQISDVQNKVLNTPGEKEKYPHLATLFETTRTDPAYTGAESPVGKLVNDYRTDPYTIKEITAVVQYTYSDINGKPYNGPGIYSTASGYTIYVTGVKQAPSQYWLWQVGGYKDGVLGTTTGPSTIPEIEQNARTSLIDPTMPEEYRGEIDDFILDNPNIIHFDDAIPENAVSSSPSPPFNTSSDPSLPPLPELGGSGSDPNVERQLNPDGTVKGSPTNQPGSGAGLPGSTDITKPAPDPVQGSYSSASGSGSGEFDFTGLLNGIRAAIQAGADYLVNGIKALFSGEYEPDAYNESPYLSTEETFDFSARTSSFMEQCKASGIFAMPSQMLGTVPSGGDSSYSFSAGTFGEQHFDFAIFSPFLATLRSLFLIAAAFAGIKIITLRGGH